MAGVAGEVARQRAEVDAPQGQVGLGGHLHPGGGEAGDGSGFPQAPPGLLLEAAGQVAPGGPEAGAGLVGEGVEGQDGHAHGPALPPGQLAERHVARLPETVPAIGQQVGEGSRLLAEACGPCPPCLPDHVRPPGGGGPYPPPGGRDDQQEGLRLVEQGGGDRKHVRRPLRDAVPIGARHEGVEDRPDRAQNLGHHPSRFVAFVPRSISPGAPGRP